MDKRVGHSLTDSRTPDYGVFSSNAVVSLGTAAVLVVVNVALMYGFALTPVADVVLALYRLSFGGYPVGAFIGMAVLGGVLGMARLWGLNGLRNDNHTMAASGVLLAQFVYGAFGGAILSMVPQALWLAGLGITGAILFVMTVVIAAVVFTTSHSFANWAGYSQGAMIVGAGGILLYSVVAGFSPALGGMFALLGFLAILFGWIADLVYEMWRTTSDQHSPLANGFGVYVAATGVFVHILQIVLRLLLEAMATE